MNKWITKKAPEKKWGKNTYEEKQNKKNRNWQTKIPYVRWMAVEYNPAIIMKKKKLSKQNKMVNHIHR